MEIHPVTLIRLDDEERLRANRLPPALLRKLARLRLRLAQASKVQTLPQHRYETGESLHILSYFTEIQARTRTHTHTKKSFQC